MVARLAWRHVTSRCETRVGPGRRWAMMSAMGARDMRFTFSNLPAVGWKLPLRDIVAMAARCEEVGFDRFAVADLQFHYDVVAVMTVPGKWALHCHKFIHSENSMGMMGMTTILNVSP